MKKLRTRIVSKKVLRAGNLIMASQPPFKSLGGIIEAAKDQHADILTDHSWNENYAVEIKLEVGKIRRIAEWLENLKKGFKIP